MNFKRSKTEQWKHGLFSCLIALMMLGTLLCATILPTRARENATEWVSTSQPAAKQNPGTKKQTRKKPVDPEATALMFNLLARYSSNAPDKSALDQKIEAALRGTQDSRAVAKRMVDRFNAIPLAERQAVFGDLATATAQKIPLERYRTVFRRASAMRVPMTLQPVGPPKTGPRSASKASIGKQHHAPARVPRLIEFLQGGKAKIELPVRIEYQGLWCVEETFGPGDDEVYLVTSVVVDNPNDPGNPSVTTVKHPNDGKNDSVYTGIDSDESSEVQVGPKATVWKGAPRDLTLFATLIEHDQGDPDAYKEEIDSAVKVAAAAAAYFGYQVPGWVVGAVGAFFNWLAGTGDDEIEVVQRTFTRKELIDMTITKKPWESPPFVAHFQTVHNGGGGEYRIYYTVKW